MKNEILKKIFNFITSIEKLKKIERYKGHFYWKDYPKLPRYESVADHTWRLGMLVMILADKLSKKINLEKALKMVLVHDLPEIIIGDGRPSGKDGTGKNTYAFNQKIAEKKHIEEKNAAILLFSAFPAQQAKNFFNLWLEYDLQKSFEAKVIKSLDKIEALIQTLEYRRGHLFKKHLEFNIKYCLKGSEVDPAIERFGNFVANEMKSKYKEFTKVSTGSEMT